MAIRIGLWTLGVLAASATACKGGDELEKLPVPAPVFAPELGPELGPGPPSPHRPLRMPPFDPTAAERIDVDGEPIFAIRRVGYQASGAVWLVVYESGLFARRTGHAGVYRCLQLPAGELSALRALLDGDDYRALGERYRATRYLTDSSDDELLMPAGATVKVVKITGQGISGIGDDNPRVLQDLVDRLDRYSESDAQRPCRIGSWQISVVRSPRLRRGAWPDTWPAPRSGTRVAYPGVSEPWYRLSLPDAEASRAEAANGTVLEHDGQAWKVVTRHELPGVSALLAQVDGAAGPKVVPQQVLHGTRIAGEGDVSPDAATARAMAAAGHAYAKAMLKVCVSETGQVSSEVLEPSGYPRWDRAISRAIGRWRHEPYIPEDRPVAICSAVMFVHHRASTDAP